MITIQWDNSKKKFISPKTGNIIDPVKAGMFLDPDLSDPGWSHELNKLGFKYVAVSYSEVKKIVK